MVGKNIGRFSSPFVRFVKSKPVLAATDQEKKKKLVYQEQKLATMTLGGQSQFVKPLGRQY